MSNFKSVTLEGTVDISKAEALYSELEGLLKEGVDIHVEAESVDRIDTSAFQLLVTAKRDLEESGATLYWKSSSEVVRNTARLLGVTDILSLENESSS